MTARGSRLRHSLLFAAVIAAAGLPAVLLARPPGHDPVVWPAAGLALGVLVARGRHLWPGVALGSFTLSVLSSFLFGSAAARGGVLDGALLLAAADTLQALFGAWLVGRYVGPAPRLVGLREIGRFLLVAGPVHTLPAAALLTDWWGPRAEAWSAFLGWWVGNMVGGLVFAPVALAVVGTPAALWRPRRWTVALPLAAAGLIAAGLFAAGRRADDDAADRQLAEAANVTASVAAVEFDRLAAGLDAFRCPGRTDRPVPPSAARAKGQDFRKAFPAVVQLAAGPLAAGPANVLATDPPAGNGFDLRSDPRLAAVLAASEAGKPAAAVLRGPAGPFPAGLVVVKVCPLSGGAIGFVAGAVDPAAVAAPARGIPDEFRLPAALTPAGEPPPAPPPGGRTASRSLVLAGTEWNLTVSADPAFLAAHRTGFTPLAVLAGAGLAALAAGGLLAATGRAAVIEEQVVVRTAELARQIAVREKAEADLRASEARLAEAQRLAKVGNWEWDPPTQTGWWSAEQYRLYNLDPARPVPTLDEYYELLHPDDRGPAKRFTAAALAVGDAFRREVRVVDPDGSVRTLHVDTRVERDAAGRPVRVTGTTQDVTAQKRAEEERRRFDEQLQETQKLESLGVLAGGVAHDFNNLLTGILGNASLAREQLPPGHALQAYLRPVEQAALHAAALCQQMLAYAGKGAAARTAFHLNRLIEDTAELLRLGASKRAELRFALGAELPQLEGDPGQIRQVLLNLVSNASEALGGGAGAIEVATGWRAGGCEESAADGHRCRELGAGPFVWVEVRDTGAGMTPEVARRVFEPFFTTKFTGRGLGLSAVHGIARSHGGCVCVTTAPGAGTTFRVYLAAVPASAATPTPPRVTSTPTRVAETVRERPAGGAGVAVVADDDPAVRQLAAIALQSLGFEVRVAADGDEAVALVREGGRDVRVVVLDVLMPGKDGREAMADLRAIRPDLPVIVMSGFSEPDVAAQFAGGGVAGFVQKPFRPVDLTACVRRAVQAGVG